MSFLRLHVAATRASTQQPALLGRVARTLRPSGIVQPRGVRWLSQAVSAEEAAVADESAQDRSTDAGSPKAAIESPKTIRNRMLRSLKEKNYGQVLAEYDAMVQASIPPDLLALNCIVEAKAQAEGTVAAQQTMKVLVENDPTLQPNSSTYVALVKSCEARPGEVGSKVEGGDMKKAFALYEEFVALGQPPDLNLYNALITVCTSVNDFTAAENIFTEMRDKGVKPKSMTYLKYIWAAFRSDKPDLAYKMLLNMENEWRVPTREDYHRMLKMFKWHNHVEGKLHCVEGLVQDINMHPGGPGGIEDLPRDAIAGLFKDAQEKNRPDEVVRLAQTLAQGGAKLDRFQQVGVILAHLSLRESVKAFSALIELYDQGLSVPERTAESIAEELAKQAASVDESYYLLESRKAAGHSVPLPAVNMVIEACAMMGDLDRAFATWAELESLGLKPNTGTYNALLHTCVRTRELASGRRLLSRMTADGVKPDSTTFMHQSSLYIMSKETSLALKVLQVCKDARLTPSAKMYVSLINLLLRSRKLTEAQELLTEMESHHKVGAALKKKVQEASAA